MEYPLKILVQLYIYVLHVKGMTDVKLKFSFLMQILQSVLINYQRCPLTEVVHEVQFVELWISAVLFFQLLLAYTEIYILSLYLVLRTSSHKALLHMRPTIVFRESLLTTNYKTVLNLYASYSSAAFFPLPLLLLLITSLLKIVTSS